MDQYTVGEWIGGGSFGAVHKITRNSDNQTLVWKAVHYGCMNEAQKKMIVSEVNILRELRSPFVVRYYDRIIDRQSATLYIVMEHCIEGDLGQLIMKTKKEHCFLDEGYIWQLAAQLTLGLHFCHHHVGANGKRERVLHRDLKPANVFLDDDLNAKLGDFGMSKQLNVNEVQSSTLAIGTPVYMSPEVVNGEAYDERSDVWALGCVIYEAAALRPPFTAPNQMALAVKIDAGEYDPLPQHFTEHLKQFVSKLLTLDRSQRPFVADILEQTEHAEFQSLVASNKDKADKAKIRSGETRGKTRAKTREMTIEMREADVKKREDILKKREADLIKREKEVEERERNVSKREEEISFRKKTVPKRDVISPSSNTPAFLRSNAVVEDVQSNDVGKQHDVEDSGYEDGNRISSDNSQQNMSSSSGDAVVKDVPFSCAKQENNNQIDEKEEDISHQPSSRPMLSDNFLATLRSPHKQISESWLRTKHNQTGGGITANNLTKFKLGGDTGGREGGDYPQTTEMRTGDLPGGTTNAFGGGEGSGCFDETNLSPPSFAARTKMNTLTKNIGDITGNAITDRISNTVGEVTSTAGGDVQDKDLFFPAVATAEPFECPTHSKEDFSGSISLNSKQKEEDATLVGKEGAYEEEIILEHYGITSGDVDPSYNQSNTMYGCSADVIRGDGEEGDDAGGNHRNVTAYNQLSQNNKRSINGSSSLLEKDNILNKYGGGNSNVCSFSRNKRTKRGTPEVETGVIATTGNSFKFKPNQPMPPPMPPSVGRVNEIMKHLKPHRQLVVRRASSTTNSMVPSASSTDTKQPSMKQKTSSIKSVNEASSIISSSSSVSSSSSALSNQTKQSTTRTLDLHVSGHSFNGLQPKPPPPKHLGSKDGTTGSRNKENNKVVRNVQPEVVDHLEQADGKPSKPGDGRADKRLRHA